MSQQKQKLSNLRRNQYFLYIAIFSLVTIVVWIGGGLFFSRKTTGIDPAQQKLAVPLNPNIDVSVIQYLENQRVIPESELTSFPIYKIDHEQDNRNRSRSTQSEEPEPEFGFGEAGLDTDLGTESPLEGVGTEQQLPPATQSPDQTPEQPQAEPGDSAPPTGSDDGLLL